MISIHAPRTGSDRAICRLRCRQAISIHAPRTGSDGISRARRCAILPFQSTLPARGATHLLQPIGLLYRNFNPRSPHGERPSMRVRTSRASVISIHAPRTGSDEGGRRFIRGQGISIHAPRTGSDVVGHAQKVFALAFQSTLPARGATKVPLIVLTAHPHFNPRSPHGERRCCKTQTAIQGVFQSTLPARGATTSWIQSRQSSGISIHAPRTGSDGARRTGLSSLSRFQSTLPARGAT